MAIFFRTSTLYCLEKDKAQHYWIILADNLLSGRYMNLYRHLLDRPMNKSIKQKTKSSVFSLC